MTIKEIKLLMKITSHVIVAFTTETNIKRIQEIRHQVAEMSEETIEFTRHMLEESAETAKIVEALILDVMISAGLNTPTKSTRSLDKSVLKELRHEVQTRYAKENPPVIQDVNDKVATE